MKLGLAVLPVVVTGEALRLQANPVSKVAQMLSDFAKKLELEAKAEQKAYNKFECWCNTVVKSKQEAIAKNNLKITAGENYIKELDSGRVELTDERTRAESEVQDLKEQILKLDRDHKRDEASFNKTKEETTQAIDALDRAIEKLDGAIEGHEEGSLAAVDHALGVVQALGEKDSLRVQDRRFLASVAQAPAGDYKKLNRKAGFQEDYKARSQKIRALLNQMKTDFEKHRTDATAEFDKATTDYDNLRSARKTELTSAVSEKNSEATETAARTTAKTETQDEVDDLEQEVTDDEQTITDTKQTCSDKKTEFQDRKKNRRDEIASVGEAIAILRSDDARDTFKSSFKSNKAESFVQVRELPEHFQAAKKASAVLKSVNTTDTRVAVLLSRMLMLRGKDTVEEKKKFDDVIATIDKMVTKLGDEQTEDDTNKDDCETSRTGKTTEAKDFAKEIDTANGVIEEKKEQIEEKTQEIKELEDDLKQLKEELKAYNTSRVDEHAQYLSDKSDDQNAKKLVEDAKDVLSARYDALQLAQMRVQSRKMDPNSEAPETGFDGGYSGNQDKGRGIISVLESIITSIEEDITKADDEEKDAADLFKAYKEDNEDTQGAKETLIETLEGEIATREEDIATKEGEIEDAQGSLTEVMGIIKEITPGCDFIGHYYETRKEARATEKKGLEDAKALLEEKNTL
mmetsp:Transcript_72656/g.166716  ORF Transcript_72656/g.166716 Transcript_72656/m.166716 type:complete len:688 (+) Transcript_72656:115-2178(+)|eukprot:CAMPEP_0204272268 /NCGR_PEP_ID=MMETSP0468-20130131/21990_1 /ASSEMBLY_ACC=CAM_ASM_000383 /TAXON_ID=2969 /ORGANISM="Oxyrrhis marina" /LENGTH=687 /DNA_ID=CAMNT_0051248095 /DNA_START=98 /DNA_END=2161 /DNA_ORIENTATION=-